MPITYDEFGHVKRPNKKIAWDTQMMANYAKCVQDIKYFAEKYYYIVNPVTGSQLIELRNYQHRMVDAFVQNKFSILLTGRQTGKCIYSTECVEILDTETGNVQKISIEEFLKLCENENNKV